METVTFKEVHAELESEGLFLLQTHNTFDFKTKSNFLHQIGFGNSIATKLYKAVADCSRDIKEMHEKYHGLYKFLLEPQLERICEKYNLYVRPLNVFTGDIPEKNVQDLMKLKIKSEDLPKSFKARIVFDDTRFNPSRRQEQLNISNMDINYSNLRTNPDDLWRDIANLTTKELNLRVAHIIGEYIDLPKIAELERKYLTQGENPLLEIAATEPLFSPTAFESTKARIIKYAKHEGAPKNRVELDPIVMINLDNCRMIVTAWGDEANDELVANQKMN